MRARIPANLGLFIKTREICLMATAWWGWELWHNFIKSNTYIEAWAIKSL
jgi:hypothetical protein